MRKDNLPVYIFFVALYFLFVPRIFATQKPIPILGDSSNLGVCNRVSVTITEKKNRVSIDVEQGINNVTIISAKPLYGLDFREFPSVVIRIEKDGFEVQNIPLFNFVPGKNKKKNIAFFPAEEYSFANFTSLQIIIEDITSDLKKYEIELWLYLR